ncbi:hypothetical protein QVD17_37930 [Tagetes erecta]|uniref:Uncharacterized protein n=1 Tax=Tagetes erecta TaxID=13708 RepID=A0AAD8JVL6_TARER|nr:hypothetical protein QVD17_37930 [Tagetes erecta]
MNGSICLQFHMYYSPSHLQLYLHLNTNLNLPMMTSELSLLISMLVACAKSVLTAVVIRAPAMVSVSTIKDMYSHISERSGKKAPLVGDDVYEIIMKHAPRLDSEIIYDRDFDYDYDVFLA